MTDSILTDRCRARMAALPAPAQLTQLREQLTPVEQVALVSKLITERRQRISQVATERRGRNPQRNGYEDQPAADKRTSQ